MICDILYTISDMQLQHIVRIILSPSAKNEAKKPLNLEISSILEASEYKLSNSLTFNIDYSAR